MAKVTEDQVPQRVKEFFEKGVIAMERHNLSYAISMFMMALQGEPRFFRARQLLRVASAKRFKESGGSAATHFLSTLTSLPQLIAGFVALKRGKNMDAMFTAEQLLVKDPFNRLFVKLLGKSAEAADMPEVAIDTLKVATDYYPDNTAFLIWLGNLYSATNQLDEAKECFETVVNLRPNDAAALKALKDAMARGSMEKGSWAAAQKTGSYRDAIKDEQEANVLEQKGKKVRGEENIELLIQEELDKLHKNPKDINTRRRLANLYKEAGRYEDAIKTLEEVKRITGSADPAIERTLSEVSAAKFDAEIEQCKKNQDSEGAAAKEAEKKAFLLKDTIARVQRYPNDLPLRYDYGVLLLETNQLNEAIQQFQIAHRNPQRRTQSLYYLALCFKKKNQLDLAREQLENAVKELPQMNNLKKDVIYELGEVHEKMGQLDEAIRYYKQIYQVDISYKDVVDKMEKAYAQQKKNT